MYYGIYQNFNFYDNPKRIIDKVKSYGFIEEQEKNYPGKRTKPLNEIDLDLFNYSCLKVLKLIYGQTDNISFFARNSFQLISYDDVKANNNEGWIHLDKTSMLTVVIYLTPNVKTSGTSIYKPIDESIPILNPNVKYDYYKTHKTNEPEYQKLLKENNSNFELVSKFNSTFNSMIAFDGCHYHQANFDLNPGEERLTQVIFYDKIYAPHFPVIEMSRTRL